MLTVDHLCTEIDAETGVVRAVDALSLTLERGETFALVGESGCGKSMTAMSLLRLLPDSGRVAAGSVRLGETDLVQLPEAKMRDFRGRRISIIFQEPSTSLNPIMTVGRQIIEVIERHTALRGADARRRAIEWLDRVGIPEPERRIDTYPFQMSGGQKQRVMIAIALAAEPDIVVADEPTTALDVTIQAQILDLLKSLQQSQRLAILLITHDLAVVAQMAHRVGMMYAGQLVEVAEAAEFFARPLHPYAVSLFQALPDAAKRGQPLASIPGQVPPLNQSFTRCRFANRCSHVMPRCEQTPPDLVDMGHGHQVRCFLYPEAERAPATPTRVDLRSPTTLQPTGAHERAAATAETLLELRDYRVWFPIRKGLLQRTVDYVRAVDGVSLKVAAGSTLALVGESGSGKSTVGKGLLQLLRQTATISGQALLRGQPLDALEGEALRAARRRLQVVFQDPFASLNPRMRVSDILEEGVAALRTDLDARERGRRIAALLDRVGLPSTAGQRFPHEFSGGQRQRLAIARALAVEPEIIVADEPTSALDVSVQAQILNLFKELQQELGVAYLFITHNFGVVEYLADEIAVMKAGKLVEAGPADQILTRPSDPYTQALLAAVPRLTVAEAFLEERARGSSSLNES
ncbi:peptide/nickel transport system ATP-binding protein [Tibeticola sediminis]|uniref:Peptide/nickel transport system ATP-binding protein n=1 Tax=Tibeticola sediminis TaxID=1917811 RepID=A0A3N4TX37_9BURK|nr:dipeptide ABC transporter ATP-binding protein [Tibeticola sediminis]RPE63022.1 peptide/nickel transport system ATP-binding protein [Tibeticola sediminis]